MNIGSKLTLFCIISFSVLNHVFGVKFNPKTGKQKSKASTLEFKLFRFRMERKQKLYYNKDKNFERRTLNKLVKDHGQNIDDDSDLMHFDDRPPAHLKGKALGLWFRDRNVRKQKAQGKAKSDKVKLTKQEKAVEQIKKLSYSIDLPEYKEKQILELLGKAQILNPSALPFFNDEPDPTKRKGEDVSFVPYYGDSKPSTSKDSDPRKSTSFLRGQVEDKYKHIGESDFKNKFLNSISGTLEERIGSAMATNYKLLNDPVLDANFKKELIRKLESPRYQEMLEFRQSLPSYEMKDAILDLIRNNQVSVISGETGCGKTTQVPQFILDEMIHQNRGSECSIMVTQPRRISAISIAERVAQERDEVCGRPGSSVGYQIRLEKERPRNRGSILYCTAGILPELMQGDPILSGVSHVILDEIHERSMITDFLLALLKSITEKRKDLKLILMSATLNAEKFSEYFGGAPILNIPGFTYPVEEHYLEDVLKMTKFRPNNRKSNNNRNNKFNRNRDVSDDLDRIIEPYLRTLRRGVDQEYPSEVVNMLRDPELEGVNNDVIFSLLQHISNKRSGAVLVFLPGWDTINALHRYLTQSPFFNSSRFQIIPLHSMLPTVSQKCIFNKPPEGVRKIVLATNIAETSITINDIVYVIDCGKTKMSNFDVKENIATLKPEWVSLANSRQRRGRAGRVQEGVCYHLYSRAREQSFQDYPLPEIQRTRLDEVVLKGKMLQLGKIAPFLQKLLDPPDPASVSLSLKLLRLIDALDDDEHLTPLGYHLAKLPLDPQIGKMLLMASIFSCVDPVFTVAASLGFKDAFYCPINMEKEVDKQKVNLAQGERSDYLVLINAMKGWEEAEKNGSAHDFCRQNYLTSSTLLLLRDMKDQFSRHLNEMKFIASHNPKDKASNINSNNIALVRAIIASGLYPNIGVIKRTKFNNRMGKHFSSIITPDDGKVCIHPKSVNNNQASFDSPFLMYYMKLKGTNAINLHDTSSVYPLPLIFFAHDMKTCKGSDRKDTNPRQRNKNQKKGGPPKDIITVRDCLSFECKPSTARLIKELRNRLDILLAHKLSHPGTIDWDNPKEGKVLLAMIELITNEDKRNNEDNFYDSEEDDEEDEFIDKI